MLFCLGLTIAVSGLPIMSPKGQYMNQAIRGKAGALVLAGLGAYATWAYFTANNVHAESGEPPKAFAGRFGLNLRLSGSEMVNHNTKLLRFELPNPDGPSGLKLTSSVLTASWPKGSLFPVLRPYTPISDLDERGSISLLVKKYPNGKSSNHLHSLEPGQSLYFVTSIPGPRWTPNKYQYVTLIAGGAGITPVYQLIQGILKNPDDQTKISLVFGVNGDADLLFKRELDEFEKQFPGRFKTVYTVSHPVEGSHFRQGYVTKALLQNVLPEAHSKDTKIFLCGPPAMETALTGTSSWFGHREVGILEELGYKKDQIFKF